MGEESLKACAEMIHRQPVFCAIGWGKPVFWTASVADRQMGAGPAPGIQTVPLVISEAELDRQINQVPEQIIFQAPDSVFRVNEVVAGIDAAVYLNNQGPATCRGHPAESCLSPGPYPGRLCEKLYVKAADVMGSPFVEDGA